MKENEYKVFLLDSLKEEIMWDTYTLREIYYKHP